MKIGSLQIQTGHLLVADFPAFRVVALVQLGFYPQPFPCARGTDQLHDNLMADQWLATPILADVAKHPVFDFVPLAQFPAENGSLLF